MQEIIMKEALRVIDEYFRVRELNELMKRALADKQEEKSTWSDIVLCSHYMFGGNSPDIHRVAANLELLILALDILDDLQDEDNVAKPWMVVPRATALNVVIGFIFAAFADLGQTIAHHNGGEIAFFAIIGRLVTRSINGQQIDLNNAINSEQEYLAMVHEKSGSLFRLACTIGYTLAHLQGRDTIERIDTVAEYAGVMAQLNNDMRDVLRFDLKNDLLHKKKTLTTLFLLQHSEEDYPLFKQFYEGIATKEQFLQAKADILEFIQNSGAIEYTKVIQTLYCNRASEAFAGLPGDEYWKGKFREIAIDPYSLQE
ncbi:MAG TPA: class 1 isoprenoid biosynthesis enzyme [Bacilli bacterium]